MGIVAIISVIVLVLSVAFMYAAKRHYDTEVYRIEHKSKEFDELSKALEDLDKKLNRFMALGK